jgi:signal transduction histidine kinase
MLHEFVLLNRDELIRRCRARVATRSIPLPSEAELTSGVPLFLDQLIESLKSGLAQSTTMDSSARAHGLDLLNHGFTVSQVVHVYGDVCQSITALADETSAPISAADFSALNRCLDDAIASAVTMYGRESLRQASLKRSADAERSGERVGFFVHELRNLVGTAIVAFEVLKQGQTGISGSTGSVLHRSLAGLRDLVAQSLNEVRMTAGTTRRSRIAVPVFMDQVASAASLMATSRGVTLTIDPVPDGLAIDADPQILEAVVGNLLQNACKFSRRQGHVRLRAAAIGGHLQIEVQDECGGLIEGTPEATEIAPRFEQRSADRSGLGIGLAFSQWGAEAHGGRLFVRNLPGTGCVFTVEIPLAGAVVPADRLPSPATV